MLQSSCSWSSSLTFWTVILSIVILCGIGWLILKHPEVKTYIIVAILLFVVCLILPIFSSPRKVQVSDENITVKMVVFSYSIPVNEIEKVEPYEPSNGGIRVCGIGGFFGNIGWFKNEQLGKYLAFITDGSKSYVIYRKNQIPVVVTADDGSIFQQFEKSN